MRTRLGVSVLVGGLCFATSAMAQWDPEQALTNTGGDIWGEGLAATGAHVHVIYGNSDVRYRGSADEGATWGSEQTLDSGVIHLTDSLVADGSDVWAIYLKNIRSRTDWCCARDIGDIYLLHSGNNGSNWDTPRRLTTARGAFRVSIAYAANRLHIVWMDYRADKWDTYYLRSPDRGQTWDTEKLILPSAGVFGAERPQVAARGDGVHVTVWDDRGTNPSCMAGSFSFDVCPDTFYIGSLDGGTTWGSAVAVDYSGAAFSGRNDIGVSGTSSVIINFNRDMPGTADANAKLFSVRSPDNGATWDPAIQLTTTNGGADHGSIIGKGGSAYLAWHDGRSGTLGIYFRGSATEGASWEAEEKVSTTTAEASTPLLAVSDSYVHAAWLDRRTGPFQIEYRRRSALTATGSGGAGGANSGGATSGGSGGGTSGGSTSAGSGGVGDAGSAGTSPGGSGGAASGGTANGGTATGGAATGGAATGGAASGGSDSDSGCGCRTVTRQAAPAGGAWLLLLALLGVRRRRRALTPQSRAD